MHPLPATATCTGAKCAGKAGAVIHSKLCHITSRRKYKKWHIKRKQPKKSLACIRRYSGREKKSPSFTTKPTVIEWKNNDECYITVTEGKFHEVRRIFETLGNCVIILKRISFYNYDLGTLKEGKIKKL